MKRRHTAGPATAFAILLLSTVLPPVLAGEGLAEVRSTAIRAGSRAQQQRQTTRRPRPQSNVTQELRRVNGRVAALKSDNDSLKAKVAVLERSIKGLTEALPALRSSLEATVKAKSAMDSSELAFVNQMSLLMNKIRLLEDKAAYIDSTNFEILSQLVLIENKIVSLTSSFNFKLS